MMVESSMKNAARADDDDYHSSDDDSTGDKTTKDTHGTPTGSTYDGDGEPNISQKTTTTSQSSDTESAGNASTDSVTHASLPRNTSELPPPGSPAVEAVR